MSSANESFLNIGLSFNGLGQLVKAGSGLSVFTATAQNSIFTVNTLQKEYQLLATDVTKNSDKITGMFKKFSGSVTSGMSTLGKAVNTIMPSLGQQLAPWLERGQGAIENFSKKLGSINKGIHSFADLGTAAFHVVGSLDKVKEALPAAFQLFQNPKALLNPDAWIASMGPVLNSFDELTRNSGLFFKTFNNLPGVDKFGQMIGSWAKSIFPPLLSGLTSVIGAVWSFTAALLANPITWIVVGVVALGAAIFLLWKNWDKVVNWFKLGFQWLKDTLFNAPNWLLGLLAAFTPILGIPLLIIKNWDGIVGFFQNIGSVIGEFFGRLGTLWTQVVNWFQAGIQWLVNAWGTITGFFANLWQQLVTPIVTWVKSIFDWIFNAGKAVIDFIGGLFGGGKKKQPDQTLLQQPIVKTNPVKPESNQKVVKVNTISNSGKQEIVKTNSIPTLQVIKSQSTADRQAALQLTKSQNTQNLRNQVNKVDKIEINLNGGKNDQQTAKIIRNELLNIFSQQGAATVGG